MGHTLRSNKPSESRLILLEFSLTTVVFALHAKKGTQGIELGADPRSGVLEREPPSQFRKRRLNESCQPAVSLAEISAATGNAAGFSPCDPVHRRLPEFSAADPCRASPFAEMREPVLELRRTVDLR